MDLYKILYSTIPRQSLETGLTDAKAGGRSLSLSVLPCGGATTPWSWRWWSSSFYRMIVVFWRR